MPKDHFRLSWASIHLLLFKYMMILENSKILFGKHLSAFFCKKLCIKLGVVNMTVQARTDTLGKNWAVDVAPHRAEWSGCRRLPAPHLHRGHRVCPEPQGLTLVRLSLSSS